MAAVDVTISGILYDKLQRTVQNVTIVGEASLSGLGVGGGPIQPPSGGGQPPLGIWGPPTMPPGFWGGGMGPGVKPQPHPEHPIVIPPDQPPPIDPATPPVSWKPLWHPTEGWIVVGVINPDIPHPTPS